MAAPFIYAGKLYRVAESPEYIHQAYMVYPRTSDNPVLEKALEGLRKLAAPEHEYVQKTVPEETVAAGVPTIKELPCLVNSNLAKPCRRRAYKLP